MGVCAVDRQDATVRRAMIASLVEATKQPDRSMVEAQGGAFSVRAPPIVSSRLDEPLDEDLVGLAFTATSGRAIGALWNYAIHGTMLGPSNLSLPAAVMGFGAALWSRLDPTSGLPADSWLRPGVYLTLPAPESANVRERIRAHLNNADFRRSSIEMPHLAEGDLDSSRRRTPTR